MSNLLPDLQFRGLIHQSTDEATLASWLAGGSRTLYAGFDPTSDSLHVGSLLPVMLLRRFQKAGHRPIALVGGATGMVGDPSGKSEERNLLSVEQLNKNVAGIEAQLRRLLDFGGLAHSAESRGLAHFAESSKQNATQNVTQQNVPVPLGSNSALLLNNFDWMRSFSFLDFLRDVGKHFPVNVMLAKDSVKDRLGREGGISYTEFSYMLLQAYDFVHLNRHHGCELQIGGSDQWGNITAGIDLARRMHGVQLYGMTCPLLLKSDGTKMGKTERGAIYLDPSKTSPYAFYQYWINIADADCATSLRFLTELSHEEITALDASRASQPHLRESQKRLAEELTRLIHGDSGLTAANKATDVFFGAEIENLTDSQLSDIFADVPSQTLPKDKLSAGLPLADALVESGLAKSKSEARRTIAQGGAYINNRPLTDVEARLTPSHLASESTLVLRTGKKKYALLRFV